MRLIIYLLFTAVLLCAGYAFAQSGKSPQVLQQKLAQSKQGTVQADILIELSTYYLDKPGAYPADMDSALLFTGKAKHISDFSRYPAGIAKTILLESKIMREKGDKAKAMALNKNALSFAVKNHLLKQSADAYLAFCDFYGIESTDLTERIKYTEKALTLYQQGNFKLEEATALKSLGDYYHLQADNTKALHLLEKSLAIYQAIHYKEIQGVYDLLGYLNARTGNDVMALKYGLLAVRTAEQVRDTSMQLCTIYNRLAITYNGLKKTDEAYYYYQKALEVALRFNQTDAIQQIKFNQIILLKGVHKAKQSLAQLINVVNKYPPNNNTRLNITALSLFATIYMDLKKLTQAKRYVDSLLFYYTDFGKEFGYAPFVNEPIIKYYYLSGQFAKAYPYLITNDSLARVRSNLTTISLNELNWSKIDSATGKYVSALKHYQEYKSVSDSLKSIDQKKQISGLQYQFDIDNKNRDILVLTQKGQLQENRINNEMMIRNSVIGGLVILMMFSGLIYSRYNVKNRSNKLLTQKQDEINKQNLVLLKLLDEKEWLLKEVHHRVKNNLQIVISLLNTQSAYLDNEDALEAIKNSQHRMHAMSLIHQKLYQSENVGTIDMSLYIRELVEYLSESFNRDKNISMNLNVAAVKLAVSQAVPVGLILNEAISNAIKYAFKETGKGKIDIHLEPVDDGKYMLCIADNGQGLPDEFDLDNTASLGMSLMQGLTQQLDGEFFLENKNGLRVCISFKAMKFNNLEDDIA